MPLAIHEKDWGFLSATGDWSAVAAEELVK